MRKRTLIILGLCMLIVISLLTWSFLSDSVPTKYERSIIRELDNHEEERVLDAAESLDYSAIVTMDRFDGSTDPEEYIHPSTYLAYTYANFIDSETISYYDTRYTNLNGKGNPKHIELSYQANVTEWSEFRIFNSPAPEGQNWYNVTVVMSAPNNSTKLKSPVQMQMFYQNQSGYQMDDHGYDFNFSDCYVVEMELKYTEIYAPTAAFTSDVNQLVVLDRNLVPLLVGLEAKKTIS